MLNNNFINKFKNKKFAHLDLSRKNKNIILIGTILILFFILFFIFIFNNSYSFIPASQVVDQTLLRVLVSVFAGFALSVAGASMQGITRNYLSGPTTLGLLPAVTLGSIVFQAFNLHGTYLIFIISILFSFVVMAINFISSKINYKDNNNFKPILVGLILGASISSVNIIIASTNSNINEQIISWLGSTTQGFSWDRFIYAGPLIIIGIFILLLMSSRLNIIEESPLLAKSLGINMNRTYWIVGIGTILVTSSSVLLIGSVVIIGIVMPHLTRIILKTRNYKLVTPISGLLSSIVIMFGMWINIRFTLGLNLFAVIVSLPVFLYMFLGNKK
ncbi:MAG: iron chelate uptake ABC transporter family permease subunit [Malacoplasma sp.]